MGNTVGSVSTNFCNFTTSLEDAYILGLWCAEKYYRTSSIGLSNTNPDLIYRFKKFFQKIFPDDRLKLRIYYPVLGNYSLDEKTIRNIRFLAKYVSRKAKHVAYHLYVNSRPLLREFIKAQNNLALLKDKDIIANYFAGRFDGDGSIDKNLRNDCRIVYSRENETRIDQRLLRKIGIMNTKVYDYKSAKTFCLYISRYQARDFLDKILPYSSKLQKLVLTPRRDLVFALAKKTK